MRAFDAEVGQRGTIGGSAVHIAEEGLVLHIQVLNQVACAVKFPHEGIGGRVANALQLPVLQVEVCVQYHLEVVAEVFIEEGEGAFQVVALVVGCAVGVGRIVMVVEDVAQFFGLFFADPFGVELAVGERPAVDGIVAGVVTLDKAVEAAGLCGCRAVD